MENETPNETPGYTQEEIKKLHDDGHHIGVPTQKLTSTEPVILTEKTKNAMEIPEIPKADDTELKKQEEIKKTIAANVAGK